MRRAALLAALLAAGCGGSDSEEFDKTMRRIDREGAAAQKKLDQAQKKAYDAGNVEVLLAGQPTPRSIACMSSALASGGSLRRQRS